MSSATPDSISPVDGPMPHELGQGDMSLMVEPPTQLVDEDEQQSEPRQEEDTVRLMPSAFQPHPPPQQQTQVHRYDQSAAALRVNALTRRSQTRTPDLQKGRANRPEALSSPSTPGHIAPFDWDDFELRYQKALDEVDEHEKELLDEFHGLVKVCSYVWLV